jgi:alpha-L-fucosidase 2
MQWKDKMLVKVVIKSTLGGNLRMRVPNTLKFENGLSINSAMGENANPFYYVEGIPLPVASQNANIGQRPDKLTLLYDIPTAVGKVYTLIAN